MALPALLLRVGVVTDWQQRWYKWLILQWGAVSQHNEAGR